MSVYNIPQSMRERRQWMVASVDKRPMTAGWVREGQVIYGEKNNPNHWLSFDEALELGGQNGLRIGYVTLHDDPFTVIDLDNLNNQNPNKSANSDEIVAAQNWILDQAIANDWYIEASQSGYGAHIVLEGKLSRDTNKGGVEFYGHMGFVVMTGVHARGSVKSMIGYIEAFESLLAQSSATESAGVDSGLFERLNAPWTEQEAAFAQEVRDRLINFNPRYVELELGSDLNDDGSGIKDSRGKGASERDADLMQGIYIQLKGMEESERDYMAIRVFMATDRSRLRHIRKGKHYFQYLVTRTLGYAKSKVLGEEEAIANVRKMADSAFEAAMKAGGMPVSADPAPISNLAVANMPPIGVPNVANEFRFLTAKDLKNGPATKWLLKGLLIERGLACMHGESGAGKSFLMLDMIAAMGSGDPTWFGHSIKKQVPICCLALEGQGGLRKRVVGWEKGKKREFPESVKFFTGDFSLRRANLTDRENAERMGRFCAALNLMNGGMYNGLIVIDTLAQAANGADENSSRDMGELIAGMKYLQEKTGSTILIVHHSTKAEQATMRGHGSLKAAMDLVVEVIKYAKLENEQHCKAWRGEKVKDAEETRFVPFELKSDVLMDPDEDGEIENAAYVQEVTTTAMDYDDATGQWLQLQKRPEVSKSTRDAAEGKKVDGGERKQKQQKGTGVELPPGVEARSKATYSQAERASGNDPTPASSVGNQQLILNAIVAEGMASKNVGTNGAPPGIACAPSREVIDRAVREANKPDPAQHRRDLRKAIVAMRESGKLAGKVDDSGKEWVWAG